jgi:uncharacterized membrane protein
MKRLASFLKTTTIGGLFVVLPLVVVIALLAKAVMGVHAAAQSIMAKLAGEQSEAAHFPLIFALLIVVSFSFLFGLAMTSRRGQATSRWFEGKLLFRIPGYAAVRAIVGGLADSQGEGVVKSGLLTVDPGIECFVFVIEDHGDGRLTVFLPGSPNSASGNVQIVRKDLVRLLNVRITATTAVLQQWGMGSAKVLAKHAARSPADPPHRGPDATSFQKD